MYKRQEPFDADVAGKKESFRKAGIEYTINQIDEYRACGIDGIHPVSYTHLPAISPQQNAAKFYKDYQKAKTAEKVLKIGRASCRERV